jgi:nucleotide-binding universal stress UspA family protein
MPILRADTVTPNPLQLSPIGIIIAVLFVAAIVSILTWMLRLPKETERTRVATKAVRSVNKQTRILVPLLSLSEATDRVVALAAQMARQRNGQVDLLVVIELPFTLPLNAHVEREEQLALDMLNRAESVAARSVNKSETRVSKRIVKARSAGAAIVREAGTYAADLILIANNPVRVRGSTQQVDPVIEYVMKNAPCEVLVLSQGLTGAAGSGVGARNA